MTSAIVIVVFVVAAVLIFRNAANTYRFESDYHYDGQFSRQRYKCVLRFSNHETGTRCFTGADVSGLYLLIDPTVRRAWWSFGVGIEGVLQKNIRIPWSDLDFRTGRVLLRNCTWFDLPSKNIHFYVPVNIGEKLLADAERKIPA
jgi:hypothetical protein